MLLENATKVGLAKSSLEIWPAIALNLSLIVFRDARGEGSFAAERPQMLLFAFMALVIRYLVVPFTTVQASKDVDVRPWTPRLPHRVEHVAQLCGDGVIVRLGRGRPDRVQFHPRSALHDQKGCPVQRHGTSCTIEERELQGPGVRGPSQPRMAAPNLAAILSLTATASAA